jgi:hypothetical protein
MSTKMKGVLTSTKLLTDKNKYLLAVSWLTVVLKGH